MSRTASNQTFLQERRAQYQLSSFLEERDVPVMTSLEPFYPKGKSDDRPALAKSASSQGITTSSTSQKFVSVNMTLDRTAQDIVKELKKRMRVLDRGSFNVSSQRTSFGRGQRATMPP